VTPGDRIIVATVLGIALLTATGAGALVAPEPGSAVLRGPGGVTVVDLDEPGRYVVPGRVGTVVFEVRDGALRAVESECPDHICVRSGAVAAGRPVVCAPNGVSAALVPVRGEGLDAVSR